MRHVRTDRKRSRSRVRLLMPLVTCVLLAGCPWMMEASPPYDLTYRGRVGRADNGAAVAGARVQIWVVPPEEVGTTDPFAQAQTNQVGEFRVTERLRVFGAPQYVTIRVTPPAGSGLQAWAAGGRAGDVFSSITGTDARYTYAVDVALQPVTGS